ncbi:MAG TPA: hypothetical protein VK961_26595 [Chthoniobacter sp.]|nr:hypothetical protein [Chthoniobacter sp.]
MKRLALALLSLGLLGLSTAAAADPMSFQELSLLLRTGETPQSILDEAVRRKLLLPLTAEQEATLRSAGASQDLLTALHTPELLASRDAVALYRSRHPATPPPVPAASIPSAQQAVASPAPTAATPARPPAPLPDLFTNGLETAKNAPVGAVRMTYAFHLDQLETAKAKAQREHKPLGFIMVWNQFFNTRASTRLSGGTNSLLHFCEAFKDSLVLVFVHHENELDKVPRAVAAGFQGPDEGGWAPNMAVVDATVSQLIVEIPCAGPNGGGAERDAVFKAGAAKIQAWMNTHRTATAAPAGSVAR